MTRPIPPSDDAIDAEILALKALRSRITRYSAFDDDNHMAIDAQIEVLRGFYDEDTVDDVFGEDPDNVRDAALYAVQWLEGYETIPPSCDWQPLTS